MAVPLPAGGRGAVALPGVLRCGQPNPFVDSPLSVKVVEDRSYAAAGVSLAVADAVVGRLRAAVESTGATGFGAFAGLHPLGDGRLLAASTDSIGTKPIVARRRGKLRACGADMAAHCINDVITT